MALRIGQRRQFGSP